MTTSEKESENPNPSESLDLCNIQLSANSSFDVATGITILSNEGPKVDLVKALKYAPVAFTIPTKKRGTPGKPHNIINRTNFIAREEQDKIIKNNNITYNDLPPKKRYRFDLYKDVQNEEIKIIKVKKKISTIAKGKGKISGDNKVLHKKGIIAGPDPAPAMPDNLKEMVARDFDVSTVMLVIQKSLFETDLKKVENRLSMTLKQIASDDFLTKEEKRALEKRTANGHLEGINVELIEPSKDLKKTKMMLRKWDLKSSSNYVLTHKWYDVVERNRLKTRDIVQIWFFRSREGKPCFAVVNLSQVGASSSSASTSSIAIEEPASSSSTYAIVIEEGNSSSAIVAADGVQQDDHDQKSNNFG